MSSDTQAPSNSLSRELTLAETRAVLGSYRNRVWNDKFAASRLAQQLAALLALVEQQPASEPPAGPYTIEPHGNGHAIYSGRDPMHHGFNLARITEVTPETLQLVERALNTYSGHEPASAPVDWLGLALDLEAQAKRVESQTVERSMTAAAHGLRLMGAAQPPASEPTDVLTQQRDHWRKECRNLQDILRNIGECISGHDGHVFDDVHALLEQSRALKAPASSQPPVPELSRGQIHALVRVLYDLKDGIAEHATDIVWYSAIQTACDRIAEIASALSAPTAARYCPFSHRPCEPIEIDDESAEAATPTKEAKS